VTPIVHALPESDWETVRETGAHRPPSLDAQGFVHCSKPGQIAAVADTNFAGRDDLCLLVLDEDRIDAPVRYEATETASAYPHVYGPLEREWVVEAHEFPRDETGFRLPPALLAL
jgi:uncharacterized protein (DUF952 family)